MSAHEWAIIAGIFWLMAFAAGLHAPKPDIDWRAPLTWFRLAYNIIALGLIIYLIFQ
jgi:hypothetical protein